VARAGAPALEYNRDIRPILNDTCFACHGPDSASRKADLRLDQSNAAVESGAIAPGDPDSSTLVERIFSDDPELVMPPPSTKKVLTPAQKETLKRWITDGAKYQPHWSFIKPERSATPQVKQQPWVRNPIDAFVLAKLESLGLTPAPEADKPTLVRRLSLDLTGLPPSPEMVAAFVADTSPDAYEKLVDQLMATPQWGEHRGRYWLDVARYADTHGIHFDNFREMWTYRDWVIEAFNRNLPFDRFTIEQLAGDLLPDRTLDQQIASGFNRCNITTNEGGVIDEEYLVLYTRDRTETTSAAWLGLTTGCAVCHDHKFDPITQREFYELAAFFNNTTQKAMDGNISNTPPVLQVPVSKSDRQRSIAIPGELADVHRRIEDRRRTAKPDFDAWLAKATPEDLAMAQGSEPLLHAALSEGTGKTLDFKVNNEVRPIASGNLTWEEGHVAPKALRLDANAVADLPDVGDFERDQKLTFAAWVKFTQPNQTGAILARMNESDGYRGWDLYVQGNRVGMHLIHTWPRDAIKTVAVAEVALNEWHHVAVTYDGSGKVEGIRIYYDGSLQPNQPEANAINNTARTTVPLRLGQRSNGGSKLNGAIVQDLRLYGRTLSDADVAALSKSERLAAIAAKPAAERTDAETAELFSGWLAILDPVQKELRAKALALLNEEREIKAHSTVAYVMQEKSEPAMAFILNRGEYDKRKDEVKPDTIDILPPMPDSLPRNRLGFAQWLLLPDQPLTARVTVNRFWQELFGTGIVRTSGDFGVSGELPANQELLDWMAVEFRETGWDMKKFFKLLVTSSTYRQAAVATPEKLDKDPQNRFCSRGPRFRMDAEMVRDYGLASSGLLVKKIGGPSVKPYQPVGVWEAVAMIGSNTRDYKQGTGDGLYRRSMYTFWKRSAPPASMDIFNAPSREVCTVRRERTNTPLQALAGLNDPILIESARTLAQTVLKSAGDEAARLQSLAMHLLARPLRAEEQAIVKTSLADLLAYYEGHAEDAAKLIAVGESKPDAVLAPAQLAAWTMLANELMNLDEVVSK
jgi:hypothetical protein